MQAFGEFAPISNLLESILDRRNVSPTSADAFGVWMDSPQESEGKIELLSHDGPSDTARLWIHVANVKETP